MNLFSRRYIMLFFLVIILVISLTTNYFTFQSEQRYYIAYNQVILDPMGIDYYRPRDNPEIPSGKKPVIFLGDSRAYSWISPANTDPYIFINRGISGQSTRQVLGRFINDIHPLRPNIIIIQVGINDLTAISLFPNRKERIIADCKANIRALAEQAVAINSNVILTTIFPVGKNQFPWQATDSTDIASGVNEVNQYIQTLTGGRVIVMDSFDILADSNGFILKEYSQDNLHLNLHGYQALNIELSKILETLSNTPKGISMENWP